MCWPGEDFCSEIIAKQLEIEVEKKATHQYEGSLFLKVSTSASISARYSSG
jgi:hypothetical protein